MNNLVLQNRKQWEEYAYIRKADPNANYWFDFSFGELQKYLTKHIDNFCLVIIGDEDQFSDFYIIPFSQVKHIFTNQYLSEDTKGRKRWVGRVDKGVLKVNNCDIRLSISEFYGNPEVLHSKPKQQKVHENIQNDYTIENLKREISIRQKQSIFRREVAKNFEQKCCLTGITETELLVASHIIPWATRLDSRLNPANGLFLFCLYDRLFDQGYFSFSNEMVVILSSKISNISIPLQKMLENIDGNYATQPINYPINPEFLEYHREHILKQ